jgi:hypothetical protein
MIIGPASPHRLKALCIFCGSQAGNKPVFHEAATQLGGALAHHGASLVFGGGKVGLMGAAADGTLAAGGQVIGVIPYFLRDKELAHPGASEMIVVPDMHTRKRTMFDRSDAFCVLPGGVGTLDETFEIITWRQLHLHDKPIIILDVDGYWAPFMGLLDGLIDGGFAHAGHGALVTVVRDAAEVIPTIERELAAPKARVVFPGVDGT